MKFSSPSLFQGCSEGPYSQVFHLCPIEMRVPISEYQGFEDPFSHNFFEYLTEKTADREERNSMFLAVAPKKW